MAINPIKFLTATDVTVNDGDNYITVYGNVNCVHVYSGTAIFIEGADNPVEAVSGTVPNDSGAATITLRNTWNQGDIVNSPMVAFNTNEGMAEAIRNVREVVENISSIESLAGNGILMKVSEGNYQLLNASESSYAFLALATAQEQREYLQVSSKFTGALGSTLAYGFVKDDTSVEINFPLITNDTPTSITLEGEAEVQDLKGNVITTLTELTLSTSSSNRVAVVEVAGLTDLIEDKPIKLVSSSEDAVIQIIYGE